MKELMKYEYIVKTIQLFFPGERGFVELKPVQVSGFNILKDYDSCFFPVFNMTLAVSPELAYKIMENKNDVEVQFRLQYRRRDDSDTDAFGMTKDIFNERFSVFIDEETPNFDKKTIADARKIENTDGTSTMDFSSSVELFLFKKDDLKASKKQLNVIIRDTDMSTAITFLASQAGVKKLLLEECDNNQVYRQVVVPLYSLLESLAYLENQYGFYKTWSTLFFDFNRAYFISKKGRVNAHANKELPTCNVNVGSDFDRNNISGGTFVEKTKFTINVTKDAIAFSNPSVFSNETVGNNLISIDATNGEVHTDKANVAQHGEGNYRVLVNKYGNNFARECELHRVKEANREVGISLADFDDSLMRPNVEYIFKFSDNKINKDRGGLYRLSSAKATFNKSGENFYIKGVFTFKQQMK